MTSRAEFGRILLVSDALNTLGHLQRLLEREGFEINTAPPGGETWKRLEREAFDLIILDHHAPIVDNATSPRGRGLSSRTILDSVCKAHEDVNSDPPAAKEAAYDGPPWGRRNGSANWEGPEILPVQCLTGQWEEPQGAVDQTSDFPNIVSQSNRMRGLLRLVKLVANSNATVLIQGESGTGKELIAGAVHRHSPRRDRPFVALDCGVLPESLLESELFGHVKGAFTGAIMHKEGLFKYAHGGTLLLDEIGNTSLGFQAKLLRVLQEGEIRPVGSNRSEKVDVRVIASTNTELVKAVEERSFRHDLYYRLAVVPLELPPLRERKEDIPLLVEHFIHKYCQQNRLQLKRASTGALTLFTAYDWPGNVRELENVIERAILLSPGSEITPETFLVPQVEQESAGTLPQASKEAAALVERKKIAEAMQIAQRNRSHAARLLGISRATLYNKLNRYGLDC